MGDVQLGLEEQGPFLWAAPHNPLQGLSPSCVLGCVTLNPCSPDPEDAAWPGRAVNREPGEVGEHRSGSRYVGGQSVPGSNDHRESHAPQGHGSCPKQPFPRDGLWIKEG